MLLLESWKKKWDPNRSHFFNLKFKAVFISGLQSAPYRKLPNQ